MSLRRKIYIVAWALYFAVVLYLSLATFDGDSFTKLSAIPNIDKVVHFSMYFILTAFGVGYIFISNFKERYIWIYVLSVIAISGLVEIVQPYMGRGRDLFDFVANSIGIIFATALVYALRDVVKRIYKGSKKRPDNKQKGRNK